ncbi:hypothetical protein SDC9_167928 [bioreactor metagenome]|uniref:Lipoprotein n=1 Tax=bioreactor metagenome TaxID=1076179 RepID=A0A645G416_9ZZZZ|nr:hypothetical protein [Oscillospiraceae bacterium]
MIKTLSIAFALLLIMSLSSCNYRDITADIQNSTEDNEKITTAIEESDYLDCTNTVESDNIIPSEEEIKQAYMSATEASFWFYINALPTDRNISAEYNGEPDYYRVTEFENLSELKKALELLFSNEVIDSFLNRNIYVEINGYLYTLDMGRGTDPAKGKEIYSFKHVSPIKIILNVDVEIRDMDSDFKVIGSKRYEFPYEYKNGKWVFTDFPIIY